MVNLFFKVKDNFLIHECSNLEALKYGDFLNYPVSHFDIWNKYYKKRFMTDFDYYPRGRVIYNIKDKCYYIYHDKCINEKELKIIVDKYKDKNYKILLDSHYSCHRCNKDYIDIGGDF